MFWWSTCYNKIIYIYTKYWRKKIGRERERERESLLCVEKKKIMRGKKEKWQFQSMRIRIRRVKNKGRWKDRIIVILRVMKSWNEMRKVEES